MTHPPNVPRPAWNWAQRAVAFTKTHLPSLQRRHIIGE